MKSPTSWELKESKKRTEPSCYKATPHRCKCQNPLGLSFFSQLLTSYDVHLTITRQKTQPKETGCCTVIRRRELLFKSIQ